MKPSIYLAAPFSHAPMVDTQIAAAVAVRGYDVRSTWHRPPYVAVEQLDAMDPAEVRRIADRNDSDLAGSQYVLAILDGGRETLCELRLACVLSIPVVAVSLEGRFPLSAYRAGVVRARSLAAAYDVLAGWAMERRAAS